MKTVDIYKFNHYTVNQLTVDEFIAKEH